MTRQQMNLDTIANNLANSSTTDPAIALEFQDMVYQNLVTPGRAEPVHGLGRAADRPGSKSAATEVS